MFIFYINNLLNTYIYKKTKTNPADFSDINRTILFTSRIKYILWRSPICLENET